MSAGSIMSNSSASRGPPTLAAHYASVADRARPHRRTWTYLFRMLATVFLSLHVAMKFKFPRPPTAMTTVSIMMRSQSGSLFARSLCRNCGTVVGFVVRLAPMGVFAPQSELFVLATAIRAGVASHKLCCCSLPALRVSSWRIV